MNQKPIATYSICGEFGINIFEIDDYDEAVLWNWSNESNEPDEHRKSSIQYDKEGNPFFMAGSENQIMLDECMRTNI